MNDNDRHEGYPSSHKDKTTERHLRGARRYEEKKQNLQERKKRGRGRGARMRDLGEDDDSWDVHDELRPGRRAGRPTSEPSHAEPNARVSEVARTHVRVLDRGGNERAARLSPRVLAAGGVVVGDDVEVDDVDRVVARAGRRTVLERRAPGRQHVTRVLAANVDVGMVVLAPRGDRLSLGFLDRALVALRSGGIEPWIVVTKLDTLANDKAAGTLRAELEPWEKAGLAVHWTAAPLGTGIDVLRATLAGKVAVVLGHSGVGKSTLVNALDPAAQQRTGAVRAGDDKGRHTTTASRLIPFVAGGALVDTPGIRQLAPDTRDVVALARSIPELAPYLDGCRYVDCSHAGEPGCRVQAAAASHPRVAGALKRLQRLVDSMNEP